MKYYRFKKASFNKHKNLIGSIREKTSKELSFDQLKHKYDQIDREELFSLDVTIAGFIAPRLRALRDSTISHPTDLTYIEWLDILDSMAKTFDLLSHKFDDSYISDDNTDTQISNGLDLFARYFRDLWW